MTGWIPLPPGLGVGAPAKEPSPKNDMPSSVFVLEKVSFHSEVLRRRRGTSGRYEHLRRFLYSKRSNTNCQLLANGPD